VSDGKIYKIFVSSTFEDLREERAAVQKALLQLNCLPVGMELFPAADDETWSFIKSQIDDSDYYVVVIAGRYGSLAPDGLSFTEKEYDYARTQNKPSIGFVHGHPGLIVAEKTESLPDQRIRLDTFLRKVKQRPVRTFTNPYELALEVTTSFVQLIRDRPAVGYVRSNDAVDYKRYAALLEENSNLKEQLKRAEGEKISIFPANEKLLIINDGGAEFTITLGEIFQAVAEAAMVNNFEVEIFNKVEERLRNKFANPKLRLSDARVQIRRDLVVHGLIEVRTTSVYPHYYLTDYGRQQLALMAP